MPPAPLRVGRPALAGGPPAPIEGARLLLDGPALRLVVVYHEPTPAEVAAVERGPVDLGVYHDGGLAALAAQIGAPGDPGRVEVKVPLLLLDRAAHTDGVGAGEPPDAYPAEVALCQARGTVVQALRPLTVPAALVLAARKAAHAQAAQFGSVGDALRAHERGLRLLTVRDLLDRAVARARIVG